MSTRIEAAARSIDVSLDQRSPTERARVMRQATAALAAADETVEPVAWAVVGGTYPSLPDEDERVPAFFTEREADRYAQVVGGEVKPLYGEPVTAHPTRRA